MEPAGAKVGSAAEQWSEGHEDPPAVRRRARLARCRRRQDAIPGAPIEGDRCRGHVDLGQLHGHAKLDEDPSRGRQAPRRLAWPAGTERGPCAGCQSQGAQMTGTDRVGDLQQFRDQALRIRRRAGHRADQGLDEERIDLDPSVARLGRRWTGFAGRPKRLVEIAAVPGVICCRTAQGGGAAFIAVLGHEAGRSGEPLARLPATTDGQQVGQVDGHQPALGSATAVEGVRAAIGAEFTLEVVEALCFRQAVVGTRGARPVVGDSEDGQGALDDCPRVADLAQVRSSPAERQEGEPERVGLAGRRREVEGTRSGLDRITVPAKLAESLGAPDEQERELLVLDGFGICVSDDEAAPVQRLGEPRLDGEDRVAPPAQVLRRQARRLMVRALPRGAAPQLPGLLVLVGDGSHRGIADPLAQPVGDEAMACGSLPAGQRLVGHVADDIVLEFQLHGAWDARGRSWAEDVALLELSQRLVRGGPRRNVRGLRGHRFEQRIPGDRSGDRRVLKGPLGDRREPVEPGRDDEPERSRHALDGGRIGDPPAARGPHERPRLDQHPSALLEKERVARRPGHEASHDGRRHATTQDALCDPARIRRAERAQMDRGQAPVPGLRFRPGEGQDQDAIRPWGTIDALEELQQVRIRPVHIVEHDDHRTTRGERPDDRLDGCLRVEGDAAWPARRVAGRRRLVKSEDQLQLVSEAGACRTGQAVGNLSREPAHPATRSNGTEVGSDPDEGADGLGDRGERKPLTIRMARPVEVEPARQPHLQLVSESGLADPRLVDDDQHPGPALGRHRRGIGHETPHDRLAIDER